MSALALILDNVQLQPGDAQKGGQILSGSSQKIQDAFKEDENLRPQIRRDLEQLRQNTVRVESDFVAVYNYLKRIEELEKFSIVSPEWGELLSRYRGAMTTSRESARDLHEHIQEFVKDVLTLPSDTDEEETFRWKTRLGVYNKNMEHCQGPAIDRANEFLRLREDVNNFHKNLDEVVIPDIDRRMGEEIDSINRNIGAARDQINGANDKRNDLADRFLGSIIYASELEDLAREVNAKSYQIDSDLVPQVQKSQEARNQVQSMTGELGRHCSDFDDISKTLSGIERIWHMLGGDSKRLIMAIESMEKEDDEYIWSLRATNMRPVYEALEQALKAYIPVV